MKPSDPVPEVPTRMPGHSSLEPVLAGTLCLMSSWANQPDPQIASKIVRNLQDIISSTSTSENFRIICTRLRDQWLGNLADTPVYQASGCLRQQIGPIH